MTEPDDFEWLVLRERGEEVSGVPAKVRAKYERLARLLEELPDDAPDPAWKQRVLAVVDALPPNDSAATDEDASPRASAPDALRAGDADRGDPDGGPSRARAVAPRHPRRTRRWILATGLAVAASAAAIFVVLRASDREETAHLVSVDREAPIVASVPSGTSHAVRVPVHTPETAPRITTEILRSARPHRSGSASVSVGDTLIVRAPANRAAELRVYGDTGEPLARCSEVLGCPVEGDPDHPGLRLELALTAPGDVRTLLFSGDAIPAAFGNLNEDVEAAQRANVDVRQIALVHVQ
jgi:hypothetical protein